MSKKAFTLDQRVAFYNAIANKDPEKKIVNYNKESDTLSYSSLIKSFERINGKPTDEELTRALILLYLIHDYNYSADKIVIEDYVEGGGSKRSRSSKKLLETDICITNEEGEIEVICEIKRIQDYNNSKDNSLENQLFVPFKSYTKYGKAKYLFYLSVDIPLEPSHFPLQCIGIDTSISPTHEKWLKQGGSPHFVDIVLNGSAPDLGNVFIKSGGSNLDSSNARDLNDNFGNNELRRLWSNLWNHIWGGTLEDNKKFENFNKVLLAKIYDESKTLEGTAYSFQRKFSKGKPITNESLANNIDLLYRKAYVEYLSKDKSQELFSVKGIDFKEFPVELISKCVTELQPYSFKRNRFKNVDVLGEFYEMVIRDAFKQTKGLFLTHPNIVLFILSALDVEEKVVDTIRQPHDRRYRLPYVIDPSCGTGTFLVNYMQYVQKYIERNHKDIAKGDEDVKDFIERNVLDKYAFRWVVDYVYGIDYEPVLATACQINLILHGDGSTNIYNTDGLAKFQEYSKESVTGAMNMLSSELCEPTGYYNKDSLGKFDFIISNPPFNVKVDKTQAKDTFNVRGKSEAFFLERWYQLLKPKGRIGVVLPESFFAVEEDISGRYFLYRHFNIKAIVSLPSHAFLPHTPTNTSLLFAEKKSIREEKEFANEWDKFSSLFEEKFSKIHSVLPLKKANVCFDLDEQDKKDSIRRIIEKVDAICNEEFGIGFIVLPFFTSEQLREDFYTQLKKKIRDTVYAAKERWVLNSVSKSNDNVFHNFHIDELGYKCGKKGCKDRPNELISVSDKDGGLIYNLKYSQEWNEIHCEDKNTVLGILKGLKIWQ
ncbi:restriction endonuclease subunit M [Idiomarina piscisalsi]|uniref:DNA methylase adenine-specific domain-containing protein n=1 Tax=Idiomarina piscisalsi TaxID=1096243 RepID=A0A432YSI9_9GAMM|nr:N-6 DNA methylase [Idiomarina piscisalsi]RUO64546.1 hypothetical protein CWI73_07595 [Idiomarina piscisalsi]